MKPTNAKKPTEMMAIPGSNRPAVPQAKLLKKSDPGSRIKVSIYARQNPTAPGKSLSPLDELSSKLPAEWHYLSDEEFNSTFGADPEDLEKIAAWAKASKLKVLDRSVPKRRVLVEGAIGDINKAFGVQLNEYDHPESGRFRGRVGQIHVPAELFGIVQGVYGLDMSLVGHPRFRRDNVEPVDFETLRSNRKEKARGAALASPQVRTLAHFSREMWHNCTVIRTRSLDLDRTSPSSPSTARPPIRAAATSYLRSKTTSKNFSEARLRQTLHSLRLAGAPWPRRSQHLSDCSRSCGLGQWTTLWSTRPTTYADRVLRMPDAAPRPVTLRNSGRQPLGLRRIAVP